MLIKSELFTEGQMSSESEQHNNDEHSKQNHLIGHPHHQTAQVDGLYHRATSPAPHDNEVNYNHSEGGAGGQQQQQHDNADEGKSQLKGNHQNGNQSPRDGITTNNPARPVQGVAGMNGSPLAGPKGLVEQNGCNKEAKPASVDDDFITIIHFNDCYNIEPGPKSSGAAGFLTAVNQFRHLDPIILFSGDILSPSFMSTFTKGEQMIPVLNDIGVHCAVFGNHEFDYGVDNLIEFTKRTSFPWLLSNVIDKETSNQLGDGLVFHTIERAGIKFGIIGLIEEEWLSTLSTLDSSDVIYEDFVTKGQELARWLKGPAHNVDYVLALTHFRTPNDIRLADSVPEIDLVLGGHDHDYEIIKRPNCYIVKSGTDFREFSLIKLKLNAQYLSSKLKQKQNGTAQAGVSSAQAERETEKKTESENERKPFRAVDIERIECVSYPPDESLKAKLEKFVTTIDEKMGKVLGQFNCELDGRFSSIRKFETNLGNFVTDIMLASTHADLAILNSGTLRSDRIHAKGDFTMRDLFNILGYIDPIAVLQATGFHIWKALENGVSQWPKLEGRFPQVSGCSFVFDPSKPPLERINPRDITIGEEPLDLKKHYKLTTKAYLASGKDGYDILKECKTLVPGDESPDLTTSILNHFEAINIVKSNRRTHHRQSIICLSRSSIQKLLDSTAGGGKEAELSTPVVQGRLQANSTIGKGENINSNLDQTENDNNNNQQHQLAATNGFSSHLEDLSATIEEEQEEENSVGLSARRNQSASMNGNGRTRASQGSLDDNLDGDQDKLDDDDEDEQEEENNETCDAIGPNTSSPLVGSTAPTPTLGNMLGDLSGSCGGCGTSMASPPSTIPRQTRQPRVKRMMSLYEMECEQCKLEPQVEGRIKILGVNWP